MNKQIEEMAVDLCLIDTCKHLPQEDCNKTNCAYCEAEALYNAGYRKQVVGEWLHAGMFDDMAKCSVCGLIDHSLNEVYSRGTYKYCPNCGARMSGGKNE